MGAITRIAWCEATFNPWVGCLRVSTACDRCYAAALSWRYGWRDGKRRDLWHLSADRKRTSSAYWRGPPRWNANRSNHVLWPSVTGKGEDPGTMAGGFAGAGPPAMRDRRDLRGQTKVQTVSPLARNRQFESIFRFSQVSKKNSKFSAILDEGRKEFCPRF